MSANFTGATFPNQKVTPANDAVIRRAIFDDGILTGCDLSYSGSTLTMTAGQLMICGRQIIHPSSQNWAVTEATSGYARLVLTIDVTRTSTKDTFDQVVDEIQYATDANGFADLTTADINATGTRYQVAVCVVSLGPGGITGIASKLDMTEGGGAGGNLKVIALAGVAVTVTKGSKVKQKVADAAGVAMFTGLETGTWTVTLPADVSPPTRTVDIDVDYVVVIAYFSATINITYPAGSTCTCSDGTTTLSAPDTSGTWACIVPNAGTWTAAATDGVENTSESVSITTDGQIAAIELSYLLWLYKSGNTYNAVTGGWSVAEHGSTGGSFDSVLTLNDDSMLLSTEVFGGSVVYANAFTNNSIDLTGVNTLKFKITGIGDQISATNPSGDVQNFRFSLVVANARPTTQSPTFTADLRILATGEYSVDVSSISAGYVGVWITTVGYIKTTLTISEIWGEE